MRRATLNETIVNKAWCENVELFFDKRLVRIDVGADQGVVARFADGSSAEGDFLIGADGVHSVVRTHVVPDGPKPFDTGLIGFGGFVPRSLIEHSGTGRRVRTTFGRSGFFGFGFCSSDPQDGVMWWSTQPAPAGVDAATFRGVSHDALKRQLLTFHAGWHDPIPQILEAAEDIGVTATLDVATLPTWSRGRTVLIGDAAHATSPHAGQGASLALEEQLARHAERILPGAVVRLAPLHEAQMVVTRRTGRASPRHSKWRDRYDAAVQPPVTSDTSRASAGKSNSPCGPSSHIPCSPRVIRTLSQRARSRKRAAADRASSAVRIRCSVIASAS